MIMHMSSIEDAQRFGGKHTPCTGAGDVRSGQNLPSEGRCSNDCFLIRKRPLRLAPTNDRFWPIPAVHIQLS